MAPQKSFILRLAALLLVSLPFVAAEVLAQESTEAEYRIKAAFIYHFLNYIQWPESAFENRYSPLVLGVVAPQSVVDRIRATIDERTASGRPLEIRAIEAGDNLETLHAIYVTRAMPIPDTGAPESRLLPLLIITEQDDAFDEGSVINFVVEDDRVRFDIDVGIARQRGLNVSAQLLTVARRVLGSRT